MPTPSHASQVSCAFDTDATFDTSSEAREILSSTLKETVERIENEGLRGTRSRHGERVVPGLKRVAGDIVMNVNPADMDLDLPRILGAAESTDVFAVAETLPDFWVMIDEVAKLQKFNNCKVQKATWRGQKGQPITLTLTVVGKSRTEAAAGGFPAVTYSTLEVYVFHQGVLTLQGSAVEMEEFELTVENVIDPKFRNSQTATDVSPGDRIVTLSCKVPYDTTNCAIYTAESAGTFASGTLVFTNGNRSITFTLNNLKSIPETPDVPARGSELMLNLNYRAYMTGSTREIVVTNDSSG